MSKKIQEEAEAEAEGEGKEKKGSEKKKEQHILSSHDTTPMFYLSSSRIKSPTCARWWCVRPCVRVSVCLLIWMGTRT